MATNARRRDERGASSVAEVVLIAPALLFALMLIVQFGLLFHARNVAEQAAQEGAASARQFDGSETEARAQAESFLSTLGPSTLRERNVSVQRTQQTATVEVTGTVISLVPGLHLKVAERASGPVERYVPPEPAP
jgi:Flp pilus assembly protein TadG